MNNSVYIKTLENVKNHRDINLITTEARRIYLVSETIIQQKKISENLLAIEMKKTHIFMNKPVYLRLSILGMSKTVV